MSDSDSDSDPEAGFDIFTEPTDFLPPDKPSTTATHTLLTDTQETLTLNLVGHNPLWGHMLWNASRTTSTYLEQHPTLIATKTILELGSGAGLPSLVCALRGAKTVVSTDYPDPDLISNLRSNVENAGVLVQGYVWGHDVTPLLEVAGGRFDTLVLSDLLFNHSQHEALVGSVKGAMKRDGVALVFFTPHRPWLYTEDMGFFEVARREGLLVRKVLEEMMEPMFEEDPGDRELRRTVFGYELRWGEGGEGMIRGGLVDGV